MLKQDIILSSHFIFSQIPEEILWQAYHGNLEFGTVESSRFREDNDPSCGFYVNKVGKIIYNDIATGEKLDIFAFVAKQNGFTYKDALVKVAEDFGIIGDKQVFYKEQIKKVEKLYEEKIIEIDPDRYWSKPCLDYWKQFHITGKQLVDEDVFSVKNLFINGTFIPNYDGDMRFAYLIEWNGKKYYKIYTPYREKYKWVNNIPIFIPFGIFTLPFIDDRVFVCKAQKDRLVWLKYFDDVIGLQNESPAALRDSTISWLKRRYKQIYILTDNDKAGMEVSQHFEDKGLLPLYVPKDDKGTKDWAEYVHRYGLKEFENILKINRLI